jgi:mannose-6-phosphate isomerase-like protein (cupin superfamily)
MSSPYTVVNLKEAKDMSGDYPGEIQMMTGDLEAEQVAFTHRHLAPDTGGMRGNRDGHSHKTQEEIYYVISGNLKIKLDDEVLDVGPGTAVRVAPSTARSVWNEGPGDAEMVMVSPKVESLRDDVEFHADFWAGI